MNIKLKCLAIDDEPLALDVIESHLSKFDDLELAGRCVNAIQAAEIINNREIDLLFLDIQMPEITGIEFLRSLKKRPMVIFTTAFSEFAVEGFELEAVDYLLKPIAIDRFTKAVEKARELYQLKHSDDIGAPSMESEHIFVKSNQKLVRINYDDILYVEAFADYVKIFTAEKRIVTLQTMKNMEVKLPTEKFCRVHRSFIVSLKHVDAFSSTQVEVNGQKIPIGKNYKDNFVALMKQRNTL